MGSLRIEPPPARRLAELSDIAESFINALNPEDEDDRRDLISEDYQLRSDIETFEQLTGKVIQPEDENAIPGDGIELEDIERSLWAGKRLALVSPLGLLMVCAERVGSEDLEHVLRPTLAVPTRGSLCPSRGEAFAGDALRLATVFFCPARRETRWRP